MYLPAQLEVKEALAEVTLGADSVVLTFASGAFASAAVWAASFESLLSDFEGNSARRFTEGCAL